jgi:hypothetical protein
MKTKKLYFLAILVIGIIGTGYRVYAAQRLDVDFDEPTYLRAGLEYSNYLRNSQYDQLVISDVVFEHPTLYKLLYGVVLVPQEPLEKLYIQSMPRFSSMARSQAVKWAMPARYLSVLLGSLAVFALAIVNPLAGFFLSTQTLSVKYTSEIYLEALPLLTSLLCVLAYLRWFETLGNETYSPHRNIIWLLLSGVFLGLTAASKYVYCTAGLGIVLHFMISLIRNQIPRSNFRHIFTWGLVAVIFFFIFDPYLWVDSLNRLMHSITYHVDNQGRFAQTSVAHPDRTYPFWQPLRWLENPSQYYDLGPIAVFRINIDLLICILAMIGLPRFFQNQKVFFCWFLIGLLFLLVWGAKWPQYTLTIMVPFSIAAGEGAVTIWTLARQFLPQFLSHKISEA